MRTIFDDILPRMGENGLIFGPSIDWLSKSLLAGYGGGINYVAYLIQE